jgi:hypothetical protein
MRISEMQAEAFDHAKKAGFLEGINFGDVWWQLGQLAMVAEEVGEAVQAARACEDLGPELADIILRVGTIAAALYIDLDEEIEKKIEYNRTRPHRHGGKRA